MTDKQEQDTEGVTQSIDEEALDRAAREEWAISRQTHGPRVLAEYASKDIMDAQLLRARRIVSEYLKNLPTSASDADHPRYSMKRMRDEIAKAKDYARREALQEAAAIAYRTCAETHHVTLGDNARAAIMALTGNSGARERADDEPSPEEQSLAEAIGLGIGGRGVAEY
jgi:hypothetical protein